VSDLFAVGLTLAAFAVVVLILALLVQRRRPPLLNVLVCGATGVGKSTLINAFAGREVTDAAIGKPVTRNTTYCPVPDKRIAFYDSQGLEVQEASQTYLLLLSDLLRLRYHRQTRKQLDFVLMCIQEPQGRVDVAHLEIAGLCEDLAVPYGIAVTKTEGDARLASMARNLFPAATFIQPVRSVGLTLPQFELPPEGVDELLAACRLHARRELSAARSRARLAARTEKLSAAAAALVASSSHDTSWTTFADQASILLTMRKSAWRTLRADLRGQVKKAFVPGRVDRLIRKRFDVPRIDGALSRRLVPPILRRFGDGSGRLTPSDLATALHEATVLLEEDRPYRSRF
jgi:hypothetical protein